jgi:hypothetical protein
MYLSYDVSPGQSFQPQSKLIAYVVCIMETWSSPSSTNGLTLYLSLLVSFGFTNPRLLCLIIASPLHAPCRTLSSTSSSFDCPQSSSTPYPETPWLVVEALAEVEVEPLDISPLPLIPSSLQTPQLLHFL